MTRLRFDVRIDRNLVPKITSETKGVIQNAVKTVAQDLARTASETAPHLTGDLESNYAIAYQNSGSEISATVEFSVYKGGFNYAIAMHEWTYNLGEGSRAKAGGTGMSGTSYPVGNKYLTRVLEGESEAYREYFAKKLNEILGG